MFSRSARRVAATRRGAGVRVLAAAALPLIHQQCSFTNMRSSCESSVAGADMSIQQFVTSKKAQKWIYLNADKSQSCLVNTDEIQWIETAANGVKRKMIERLGGEVARATTVVQFGANASFPEHEHEGGEEFIVLAGDWIDDWATQPKNTYVRNYIGSRHTPRMGPEGVTILVKLCQMSEKHPEPEHTQWDISEANPDWKECTDIKGRRLLHVFKSPNEEVRFERWMPGAQGTVPVPALGEEVFVLEGSFSDGMGEHRKWSWARNSGEVSEHVRKAGAEGCFLYVKSKHLKSPEVDLEALCLKRQ